MRFLVLGIFLILTGCGESATDTERKYINIMTSEFHETQNLLAKKKIADDIAKNHWNEKSRFKWTEITEELKTQWKLENCTPGFKSYEEKRILSEVASTRVSFNDYRDIAWNYRRLFDLCGNENYLEPYAEFSALAKFASKTRSICGEVVHTYSGEMIGRKIRSSYEELKSMNESIARKLGDQAVEGYGECMCVMHDYFKVKDNFSIGFCVGPEYFTCSHPQISGAYCGESGDRAELAKTVGDFEYRVPRGNSSYGSYASPGSTAADLLEWGKAQTESLVRDYCSGNPDC